jgi:hypothetical protein
VRMVAILATLHLFSFASICNTGNRMRPHATPISLFLQTKSSGGGCKPWNSRRPSSRIWIGDGSCNGGRRRPQMVDNGGRRWFTAGGRRWFTAAAATRSFPPPLSSTTASSFTYSCFLTGLLSEVILKILFCLSLCFFFSP